ncbi:septation ring formation regulator EzrA [Natribacillus halophilus]|uniref:Septation ring formation regulator n=1 Tax=Natribacillus halophilus TaxID=549003 RepID=A0A1G8NEL7_9BACI|nr:septation ring formation regulator EzrA [Natribacillus halophilus]SDI78507.1 septation ring formation regulator [Natribacillus halophilus]
MVYFFIAIFVVIALVVAYGVFNRRHIYQRVDNLDQRKGEVMGAPVADEISRVKGLTISGETEEKFERWRQAWDEIVDERLPEMEMELFDIEEIANKYQFRRAKDKLLETENRLKEIEKEISEIRHEVEQLVNSEEKNREEIEKVTETYREVRSLLSRQWRALGEAAAPLEEALKKSQEELDMFYEETESGNYMRARERLLFLQETLERLQGQVETIPAYLHEIDVEIPKQVRELRSGVREMEEQAFSFQHFTIHDDLKDIDASLADLKKKVNALELDNVSEKLQQIKETIEQNYRTIEEEVEAKHEVEKGLESLRTRHKTLVDAMSNLDQERANIEVNYHLSDKDKENFELIKKEIGDAEKDQQVLEDLYVDHKQSYVDLQTTVKNVDEQMAATEKNITESLERLQEMRGEERRAMEQLKVLRVWLKETHYKMQKSKLPAVPEMLVDQLDAAGKELEKATALLEMTPLEMRSIQDALEQSQQQMEAAADTLDKIIDEANWAERLLQFGNRYRREFEELNPILNDAERQFRNGFYEDAIRDTSQAFERLVPNAFTNLQLEWGKRSQRQVALDKVR